MTSASPWWDRGRHADRRPFLLARNRILQALRRMFCQDGFIEVEGGALQVSPGNETHLHAFVTDWIAPDGTRSPFYLHTSPEFSMKKLLAAGEERLFTLAQVFRNREISALHAPEFTLLEWYRANQPYERIMGDCAAVLRAVAEAAATSEFRFAGRHADPFAAPERLSVCDAFARHGRIDLMKTLPQVPGQAPDRDALAEAARAHGIRVAADDTWSDIFSRILTERIEPHLGIGRATILFDYPGTEAALARRRPADPRFAERFELYVCGVELANAFGELTDAAEQRRRFEADMAEKQRIYGEAYPLDEDFIRALEAIPPASGVALGIERLVMLATGATRIEQVVWTPFAGSAASPAPGA